MRVLLLRQVQLLVQHVHVRQARCPAGDPAHRDLAEHRHQRPAVILLRPCPHDPLRAGHVPAALLTQRPQVQLPLEHQPQQLPAPLPGLILQIPALQRPGLRPRQPSQRLLEPLPDLRERFPG